MICSRCNKGVLSQSQYFEKEYQCGWCGSWYRIQDNGSYKWIDPFKFACQFSCRFYDDATFTCPLDYSNEEWAKDWVAKTIAPWWCSRRKRNGRKTNLRRLPSIKEKE